MAAHQAPPSLGFSRQEYWSGSPLPSPMCASEIAQSCLTPSNPMDCSLPGPSIYGIFQTGVLEWGAIAFIIETFIEHLQYAGLLIGSMCMCDQSLQWCATPCDPMDCSLPGSSVHRILQARILEWVAMPSSMGSSWSMDWTCVSCITGRLFTLWATWEAPSRL